MEKTARDLSVGYFRTVLRFRENLHEVTRPTDIKEIVIIVLERIAPKHEI